MASDRPAETLGVSTGQLILGRKSCIVNSLAPDQQSDGAPPFDATAGLSTIPAVIERLRLTEPTPVVVIIGGADNMSGEIGDEIRTLFERSLSPTLETLGVVVMTGGTDSGVMAIAGQTLSSVATLVGVSPRGPVTEDASVRIQPDHHLSVLTAGSSWGSETDYMVELASAITQGARCGLVLLINGGAVAFEEVTHFVDKGWPIVAIAGSGGVADDLIRAKISRKRSRYDWKSLRIADVDKVAIDGSSRGIRERLAWYMSEDELLKSAWTYFAAFDRRAKAQQNFNKWVRVVMQLTSLAILSLVLIQFQVSQPVPNLPVSLKWISSNFLLQMISNITVPIAVALPVALAAAAAINQSVAADRGWRILRGSAESLQREIYRYRASLTLDPGSAVTSESRRQQLTDTINAALRRSATSGFLLSVDLTSHRGRPNGLNEGDDELAPLTVASYTSHRIDGQIAYFQAGGRTLRRRALAVILAGVLLAAISGTVATTYFAPWAAVAVLGVTALTAYLERSRLTERASRFATASADLAQIKTGINLQRGGTVTQPEALFSIVLRTEAALEGESAAWEQLVWRDVRESQQSEPRAIEPGSSV